MAVGVTNAIGSGSVSVDGVTIQNTSGTLSVKEITESKVTNLTSDLALKVPYVDSNQTFKIGYDTTVKALYYEI